MGKHSLEMRSARPKERKLWERALDMLVAKLAVDSLSEKVGAFLDSI